VLHLPGNVNRLVVSAPNVLDTSGRVIKFGGVFISSDYATKGSEATFVRPTGLPSGSFTDLVSIPMGATPVLLAALASDSDASGANNGIYRSSDGGQTWNKAT